MPDTDRLTKAYAAIDAANAADPLSIDVDGMPIPAALIYGRRMTEMLRHYQPDASEALKIAIRGQHIERFAIPRETYPEGKAGYYRWRNEQKKMHARRLAEIMAPLGYANDEIERVGRIVRKEDIKTNDESQTLEDVA